MNGRLSLKEVLQQYRSGEISLTEAERRINSLHIEMVEDFARLDTGRSVRCGLPEVVIAEGKSADQLIKILRKYVEVAGRCIATRVTPDQAANIRGHFHDGISCEYNASGRTLVISRIPPPQRHGGCVGIITAGTSDVFVAEEARVIAEEMGCRVRTAYDVGAAGIHRLFPAIRDLQDMHVIIVAAGREGTLPAVVAGLVDQPVIGVPVSTGYGYMGKGEAALASMLQSCAVLTVVNIDAGFVAGAFAARIAEMVAVHE
jgi:NCAIR mutase (PurE)-related protein